MHPVTIHTNNNVDDTFLSLLSSQRELLRQLNGEPSLRAALNANRSECIYPSRGISMNDQSWRFAIQDSNLSTSLDMSLAKRLSLGFGSEQQYILPGFVDDHLADLSLIGLEKTNHKLDDLSEFFGRRKKRRLSSLGFVSASFFDDYLKPLQNDVAAAAQKNVDSSESQNDSSEHDNIDEVKEENVPIRSFDDQTPNQQVVDPIGMKSTMESFNESMLRSQKSQQAIHDWDRKMGLKRSHSKTMRLSSRSRKKLCAFLRKEITTLSSKA